MKKTPLLSIQNIGTRVGSHTLLRDVSLEVTAGETLALLGRNGSGKSSVLKSIMGIYPAYQGEILLDQKSIKGLDVHQIARSGVGYIPEDQELFDSLTVEENFQIAQRLQSESSNGRKEAILEHFPDLKQQWKSLAGVLSGGQRQMLAIARCLVNENRLILIDEPSKGLAPVLVDELIDILLEIKGKETVILVEQNIRVASECADRCIILDDGLVVKEMQMQAFIQDEDAMHTYLGVS